MDYIKDCNLIISELGRFSSRVIDFGNSLFPSSILEFEKTNDLKLPNDFKYFISKINGFNLMGIEVLGFGNHANSIENVYYREHYEVQKPPYGYLVPFQPDGGGNFYCLDTQRLTFEGSHCPVVFWYSNYTYTDTDTPEDCSVNFLEHLKTVVLEWTLEDYDYEGNSRIK